MIQPTLRGLVLAAGALVLALFPAMVHHQFWIVWAVYTGCFLLVSGFELIFLVNNPAPDLSMTLPAYLYTGVTGYLRIRITRAGRAYRTAAELVCDCNEYLLPHVDAFDVILAQRETTVDIPLTPVRRGTARCLAVSIRWNGVTGLLRRYGTHACPGDIPVLPDYNFVRNEALRFFGSQEQANGLKIERHIGEGSEFERLQEYVPGLDHRAIDWKASARHRMLLCREFRAERNHQIILALDTGNLMCEYQGTVTKLDHAINAALLLAYLSLRVGDRVGLFSFADSVNGYHEAHRGPGVFARLQHAASVLAYVPAETNFTLAMADLSTRLRQRALVVVFTDFIDTVTAGLMVESLDRLFRRHLVLFVTFSARHDPGAGAGDGVPRTPAGLAETVVESELRQERSIVIARLRRIGIQIVEATPGTIPSDVVNRYLDIKRREMIT